MQCVLQKIDRSVKPIKKNYQIVTKNLEEKNIFLEQENFDILKLLQSKQQPPKSKDRKKDSVAEIEKAAGKKNNLKRQKTEQDVQTTGKIKTPQKQTPASGQKKKLDMKMIENDAEPLPFSKHHTLTPKSKSKDIDDRFNFNRSLVVDDDIHLLHPQNHVLINNFEQDQQQDRSKNQKDIAEQEEKQNGKRRAKETRKQAAKKKSK